MSEGQLSLQDREQIVDVIYRYCSAVDDNDCDAVASLFVENCVVSFASGPEGTVEGRDSLRRRVGAVLRSFRATSHHVSNVRLRYVENDVVEGTTYLYAWHRFVADRDDGFLWGRYHDRFVRTSDGWKLSSRTLRVTGESGFAMQWNPPHPPRIASDQSASQPPSTTT